jgi:hypothetical protein
VNCAETPPDAFDVTNCMPEVLQSPSAVLLPLSAHCVTTRLSFGENPLAETETFCVDDKPDEGVIVIVCLPADGAAGPAAVVAGVETVVGDADFEELPQPMRRSPAVPTAAKAPPVDQSLLEWITTPCWRARGM